MTDYRAKRDLQPTVEDCVSSESSEEETETEDEVESNSRGSNTDTVVVTSTNHHKLSLRSELLPVRYDASGRLVLTPSGRNAAAPLCDLEKKIAETFKPRDLTVEEEIEVQGYLEDWQDYNNAIAADSIELFDLCLESEDLIYEALRKLNVHQQLVFRITLSELGYEVQSKHFHHDLARSFGERLPIKYLCANISPELRREAEAAADFPPEILRNKFGNFLEFDPQRREWDARLKAVQDNWTARRYKEAVNLPESCDQILHPESPSQGEEINPTKRRPLPNPPSIKLSPSSEDLPNKESNLRGVLNPSSQQDRDLLALTPPPVQSSPLQSDSSEKLSHHFHTSKATEVLPSFAEGSKTQPLSSGTLSDSQAPHLATKEGPEEFGAGWDNSSDESKSSSLENPQSAPCLSPPGNMAISTEVALPLPVLPEGWTADKDFKVVGSLSPATQRSIEPVGPHFLAHARRARHKRTFSEDDRIQAQESVKKVEDEDAGDISEPEDPAMLLRDAKDWKGQDHYAVLGLSKYRWKATEEQIKRAHRKKVLRHHPDKKAAAGSTEDDSFFKCIQKATEVLLDPVKRRQFDSVDEAADIEPPSKKQTEKGNIYKLWSPVFKSEGRFSRIQPVPKFGDENSTKEDVENFYNFWYNFDSWRSFEYQDEDVPDDNENRDQKRHMERKNANARRKKKTEDSARLRKLLDDCSALDPRIKKFRQEASASKNKKRLDKEAAEKKAAEEAKAKKEAEEKAAKEAEEAAKIEKEAGKKAKEAAKTAVKKNKRVLKSSVKDANYFAKGNAPAATIDAVLNDVELVQGKVDPDEIAVLAGKLNGLKVADEIKTVWSDEVKRLIAAGKLKNGDAKHLVI